MSDEAGQSSSGPTTTIEAARKVNQPIQAILGTILLAETWTKWAQATEASALDPAGEPTLLLMGGGRLSTTLVTGEKVVEAVSVDEKSGRVILTTSSGMFGCPTTNTVKVTPTGEHSCEVVWQLQLGNPPGGWTPRKRKISSVMASRGINRSLKKLEKVTKKRLK